MTLEKLHSLAVMYTQRIYDKDKTINLFVLIPDEDKIILMDKAFFNDAEKSLALDAYTMFIGANDLEMYSIVAEAWICKKEDTRPAEHPDRKNCIIIVTESKDKSISSLFEIENGQLNNSEIAGVKTTFKLFDRPINAANIEELLSLFTGGKVPYWFNTMPLEDFIKMDA